MALVTEMVYLYPKENSEPHKTKNYEMVHHKENPVPVLRRGMKFTMAMRFQNRDFNKDIDIVRVFFNYGPNPNRMRDTQAVVRVDPNRQNRTDEGQTYWFANVLNADNETLTIEVFARPNIPIGLWGIQVETTYRHSNEPPNIFDYEGDLWFICNPWNCHDLVYMPDTRLLDEYVLTDVGKIWVGPVGSSRGREWIFGQFDESVLPAVWVMLEKSGVEYERRGDPIKLARIISKMVNSNDDDGIIEGAWHGQYEDGTAPSEWTGSVAILEQYLETQAPVKYGQCWVFAGVITTICRAIGIPSRVVSNLVSAHDANSTLTVDKYFDENNEEITIYPPDSIWNYHVWNDVYMARPDLPSGYGGWQAIDATPQETSDGFYQCGPASLEAVKNGQVGLSHDVGFILASVNADLFRWKKDDSSEWGYKKIFFNKYHIGKYILTKKPFLYDFNGDRDREDITCQYKPKEGSPAERASLLNAVRATSVAKRMYEMPETEMEDIFFDLKDIDKINIGEDFNIKVEINNKSDALRNIKITLSAISVFYNGVKGKPIAKKESTIEIPPHKNKTVELYVEADVYLDKLVEYSIMKINAIATVQETQQTWADEDDFQVIKPKFKFIVPDLVPVNEVTFIKMTFKNPLKKYLTNCKVSIAGPTLLKVQAIAHPDVQPEQVVEVNIGVKPKEVGDKKLVVTFSSRELSDISGSTEVSVSDPNAEE